ncbi:hypothetical protein BHE74_00024436 [Ensete ventricosum]|nr:hypothetical protein BHE74_00024436 [Ensete ventricosum]
MLEANVKPDHVIMTAVLSACSHAGLIDVGWKLFNSTIEIHGIRPTMRLQRNQPPPSHNFSDFLLLLLILGSAFAAWYYLNFYSLDLFCELVKRSDEDGLRRLYHIRAGPRKVVEKALHINTSDVSRRESVESEERVSGSRRLGTEALRTCAKSPARLGSARVRKLICVDREEVGRLKGVDSVCFGGRLGLLLFRGMSRNPTQRHRRGGGTRRGPSDDQVQCSDRDGPKSTVYRVRESERGPMSRSLG